MVCRILVAIIALWSVAYIGVVHSVEVETEKLEPTHTMHRYPDTHFTGTEHPSSFPSVKIEPRTQSEQQEEVMWDEKRFEELYQKHQIDQDANPISTPSTNQAKKSPGFSAADAEFMEKASSTLSSVMQHDAKAVFHYKSLVARAKETLQQKQYDHAATLFKEAAKYYLDHLKAPYAKIASAKDLGRTIEQRIAAQLEQERAAGLSGAQSTANTAAQQFREKELANQPHVHTAFIEYQKTLKQAANAKVEAAATKSTATRLESQKKDGTRRR